MPPFVDGYCHAVQDHCLAVPGFRGSHDVCGQVMETGSRRGERVSLAVELFCDGADKPEVDANVPEVAGHFFDTKHPRFGQYTSGDLRPEFRVSALWWGIAIQDALESVDHCLVVDKDVDGPLGAGGEVDNGQGLGNLGILGNAVNSGAVIHAVFNAVVYSVARPRQKWYSLVSTGAVRGRVGPGPARGGIDVSGVGVWAAAGGGRSWNGLGQRVSGELRLQIKERRVFIKETAVARVGRETAPLLVADQIDKWGPLTCPALAVTYRVLLSLFLLVTVTAEGTWVSGGVGARSSLLGVVTTHSLGLTTLSTVLVKLSTMPG